MTDTLIKALDEATSQQIKDLCQQGYDLYDQRDYKMAIRHFFEAWNVLPKPQSQWAEAGWVLTALGDSYFKAENYKSGVEALSSALHCPEVNNNPFIHLRLGQCLYEEQQFEQAIEQLKLAQSHGGEAVFKNEAARYRELLNGSTNT